MKEKLYKQVLEALGASVWTSSASDIHQGSTVKSIVGNKTGSVIKVDRLYGVAGVLWHKSGEKDVVSLWDLKLVNEEIEQIDEISKKVLGSYINKAHSDATYARVNKEHQQRNADDEGHGEQARAHFKKYANEFAHMEKKRTEGIKKATARLAKESVEPIEEAAGHYVSKDANGNTYHVHIVKNKNSEGHSLYLSNQHGNSLDRGSLNVAHAAKGDAEHRAKADETVKHFEKGGHRAAIKHLETISKSKWSHVKESVEPIEEISKKVLASCVKKGDRSHDNLLNKASQKWRSTETNSKAAKDAIALGKKADRRANFLNKADAKLKEEVVSEAVKTGNEGHGFRGQAYLASMSKNEGKDHNHVEVENLGSVEQIDENHRENAQKGIGAHSKDMVKKLIGQHVDYYHPKTGDKREGKITVALKHVYTLKDSKSGEQHHFEYARES